MAGAHGVFGKTYCKCRALRRAACSSSAVCLWRGSCLHCPAGITQYRQPGGAWRPWGLWETCGSSSQGQAPSPHMVTFGSFPSPGPGRPGWQLAASLTWGGTVHPQRTPDDPYPLLTLRLHSASPALPHLMALAGCTTFLPNTAQRTRSPRTPERWNKRLNRLSAT